MKDKKQKVESRLRNLEIDKSYVDYLKKELELLEEEYGLHSSGLGEGGKSNSISDNTGNQAANLIDRKEETELRLKRAMARINHIETLITKLTDTEESVIRLYYMEYKPLWYISGQVKFSQRQVQRIKDDALGRLIRGMYGERE